MALTDMKLRQEVHPDLATKGTALTFEEMDVRIKEIYDALTLLMGFGAAIAPYDPSTTYQPAPPATYVSYLGNIFQFISATPTTGVAPPSTATSNATWELSSIGQLSHAQNTDQYLDFGGVFQIHVQDLHNIVGNGIIQNTYAEIEDAITSGDDKVGRWYWITDKNIIAFYAQNGRFSHNAIFIADYTGAGQIDNADPTKQRLEKILYDFDTDEIYHRWDSLGNQVSVPLGFGLTAVSNFAYGYETIAANIIKDCDITFDDPTTTNFSNNEVVSGGQLTVAASSNVTTCQIKQFSTLISITLTGTHAGKRLESGYSNFEKTLDLSTALSGTALTIPAADNYIGRFLLNAAAPATVTTIINHPAHPCEFNRSPGGSEIDITITALGGAANTIVSHATGDNPAVIFDVEDFILLRKGATQLFVVNHKQFV